MTTLKKYEVQDGAEPTDTFQMVIDNTGCPRKNGQNFGRVFLMLKYTDITQNTYIQS